MKKQYRYSIVFFAAVFISVEMLFENLYNIYSHWPGYLHLDQQINFFMNLYIWWAPSLLCLLYSILCFKLVYKYGSIKKGFDEFMLEQKGKKPYE